MVALAMPVRAQRTLFQPSLRLSQGYSNNVGFTSIVDTADSATALTVDLPVTRSWNKGSLAFGYRPSYVKQSTLDSLDRWEHRLLFGTNSTYRSGTQMNLTTTASRTQIQANAQSLVDSDPFLTQRTNRDLYNADLQLDGPWTRRWSWRAAVGGSTRQHGEIEGFNEPGIPAYNVEDRDEYRLTLGSARQMNTKTSLGGQYRYRHYELERSGAETVHEVSLTYNYASGRRSTLGAEVGAFFGRGTALGQSPGEVGEREGVRLGMDFRRTYRIFVLQLIASHAPSSGGSLQGTSANSRLSVSIADRDLARWDWYLSTGYARRDPSTPGAAAIENLIAQGSIERIFRSRAGISLNARYATQTNNTTTLAAQSTFAVALGLVWYPLGHTRIGKGVFR